MNILRTPRRKGLHILQDDTDKAMAKASRGLNVSCKSGCSACCKQWVGVMWLEALDAVEEAKRVGYTIDQQELHRQSMQALQPGMTQQRWFGTPCVFLTPRGTCAIYKRRPLSCRGTLVVSDPVLCGMPDAQVTKVDSREPVRNALYKLKVEHYKEAVTDIVGPLPLMVDLVLRGKSPQDVADKARLATGVIGLDLPTASGDGTSGEEVGAQPTV